MHPIPIVQRVHAILKEKFLSDAFEMREVQAAPKITSKQVEKQSEEQVKAKIISQS